MRRSPLTACDSEFDASHSDQPSTKGLTMLNRIAVVVAGLVLVGSACSAGDENSTPDLPEPNESVPEETAANTDTPTEAPESASPSVDLGAAGDAYLEIINPVNCAAKDLLAFEADNSLGDGTVDPARFDSYMTKWKALGDARQVAYRALLDAEWPADVDPEIVLLAKDWASGAQREQSISQSADVGLYNVAVQAMLANPPETSGNPGYIRALLNLGTAEETDRC